MKTSDWDTPQLWRQQIERRLNELGSAVKGNQSWQADRIADVMEQIAELRRELASVKDRQDRIAAWLKEHFPRQNGGKQCGTQS